MPNINTSSPPITSVKELKLFGMDENEEVGWIFSNSLVPVADYAAGIEITQYNQLVRDENGEFWRVSGQVDLPYVTTGAGIPEDDALVPVGDAVLRQDLANPGMGATMVARGVVAVDSVAELLALPAGQRRGDLRYMVCDSVFLWDGAEFIPQGYVDVGAWLLDYSEPAEAIEAAINSGWPLDFKRLKINVGRPISPDTIEHEIDWVSDGCVVSLTTGPHEYVLRLRVPVGSHSINGRLCFDAARNAYSGLQVWSTQGNCVFESEKLEARNIYRSAKLFIRGDGLFFRGGFSRLHLKSPKVVGVILAPGAGLPGSVGAHGITAASDPTSGLYPLYTVLDDPHVEDVYSEDIEYTMDQDGCRLFGQSAPTAEEENSVAIVNGGEFINCAGRSIKGQVSSLIVNGTVFRRDNPFLRESGNGEIASQTGTLLASNIKAFYYGKAPDSVFSMSDLYNGPSTGHSIKNVSVTVKDVVLPYLFTVSGGARGPVHADIDGVTVSGSIERIAWLLPNSDNLTFSINNVVADEITNEGILTETSTGGAAPYLSTGTITNVTNRGTVVPLVLSLQPGHSSAARISASGVVGFIRQEDSGQTIPMPPTVFRAEGFSGLDEDPISVLRIHGEKITPQETAVFPAHSLTDRKSVV